MGEGLWFSFFQVPSFTWLPNLSQQQQREHCMVFCMAQRRRNGYDMIDRLWYSIGAFFFFFLFLRTSQIVLLFSWLLSVSVLVPFSVFVDMSLFIDLFCSSCFIFICFGFFLFSLHSHHHHMMNSVCVSVCLCVCVCVCVRGVCYTMVSLVFSRISASQSVKAIIYVCMDRQDRLKNRKNRKIGKEQEVPS